MPIYEYVCRKCGYKFELFRHFYDSDENLICPICEEKGPEKQFSVVHASGSSGAAASCSSG